MRQALILGLILLFPIQPAHARDLKSANRPFTTIPKPPGLTDNIRNTESLRGLAALSPSETTVLYSAGFNVGQNCSAQGWTSVDLTAQLGTFWHVDDYAGLPFGPLQGTKSLWCGLRPGSGEILCQYQHLPGYGNNWDQSWCTKNCQTVAGGATVNLDVSFDLRYDSEASYDGTSLEYTTDCSGNGGWTKIDGGTHPGEWNGSATIAVNNSYNVGAGPVKVRLHFTSDNAWSDEDGGDFDGAAHVDNLKVETLATENFEDEAVGATSSNDWQSCNTPGFGDYSGLFHGATLLQRDICTQNLSCIWAFIQGSVDYFTCGGYPTQQVVPYGNDRGQYIHNEIWSPQIALTGSGEQINLAFDVYRDNAFDPLVFYQWKVRTIVGGCPTAWKNDGSVNDSYTIGWYRHVQELGPYVNLSSATHIQVALGVVDMCFFWCGSLGTGNCHTNGPMFDNVKVYRVNVSGPFWSVNEAHLFQDTFPTDGTITGIARADMALDIGTNYSSTITPGDSSVIFSLMDPAYSIPTNTSGLSNDPNVSTFIGRNKTKKQVYMWVSVWPQGQANKSGDGLSEGPGGQANRYPHIAAKDFVDSHGVTWSAIRADYTYQGNSITPGFGTGTQLRVDNRFNVDLNDNLFTPGDTVCFFFGATSPSGTTYYSDQWHVTDAIAEVAANPMEFTVLPAGGFNRGGDILYVDGADGFGNQPYFDSAFDILHIDDKVDRYDVRAPGSRFVSDVDNTLSGRVKNVAAQLNAAYRGIMWDCGSMTSTLGDAIFSKTDDYALLNSFLNNLTQNGGVYLCGDDVAQRMAASVAASAVAFKSTYMPFNLLSSDHVAAGLGVSPRLVHWPARSFTDDAVAYGGCPTAPGQTFADLRDFDVLGSTGTSRVEMSYGTAQSANGAVISNQTVNANGKNPTVVLSGFSFASMRDDDLNGKSDRAVHLREIIVFSGMGPLGQVTTAGPSLTNSLAQNYPNPFNPQTTIAFSIAQRANVDLEVYDVNGALVRTLANDTRAAGAYQVEWDGRDTHGTAVASGVYFYKLNAGSFTQTRKMVLLK